MSRSRPRVQVVIRQMPGAEVWYRIEHVAGAFKLPGIANIEDLFTGALEGWSGVPSRALKGEPLVRVPLSMFQARTGLLRPLPLTPGG